MAKLADFELIKENLSKGRKMSITALHKFIFQNEGDRTNRKRLRQFTGFNFTIEDEQYQQKMTYVQENLTEADLTSICLILCLSYDVKDKKSHIFKNLIQGKLLLEDDKEEDDEEEENEEEEDDEEEENEEEEGEEEEENGEIEDDNKESRRGSDCLSAAGLTITERRTKQKKCHQSSASHSEVPRFTMAFRDVEDSISKFDGSKNLSIRAWLEEFEETSSVMEWNEFQKYVVAKKLLQGLASLFIRSKRGVTTWAKLRSALIEEFEPIMNSALCHKQLAARVMKKDESLQEYFLHMRELGARACIEDVALIEYIIDGISDSTQNKQILYGVNNLYEFKKKLQCYETIHTKKQQEGNNKIQTSKTGTTKMNNRNQKTCFNCGTRGHLAIDCKNKEKGVKCFNCNAYGHYAKECPNPSTSSSSKVRCVEVKTEGMIINASIDNISCRALFDTGSKLNLLSDSIATKLTTKAEPSNIRLFGFGNKDVNSSVKSQGAIRCEIIIDREIFETSFQIVPKRFLDEDCILGEEFCKHKEIIIDDDGVHFKNKLTESYDNKFSTANEQEQPVMTIDNVADEVADIFNISIGYEEETEVDIEYKATQDAKKEVLKLINNYTPAKTKFTNVELKIILMDETPICSRPNRLPLMERRIVDEQIAEWLQNDIIEVSESEFTSPIILVKKRDGSSRLCVDYRKVNKVMVKDRFPLPLIEDQLDNLQGASIFSTIDLSNGFFHVPVAEDSRKYTSFVVHNGQYQFKRVPFGLCNSPSVFQRHVNAVFRELYRECIALPYVDDIIIPASNEKEAVENLKRVLITSSEYGLELNMKKCQFLKRRVEFLGYVIEDSKIAPSPRKIEAVLCFQTPKNFKQLQSFLGLAGYFRKFIQDYSLIAKPLSDLLKKGNKFEFNQEHTCSFQQLKQLLSEEPVLALFDQKLETEVHTDASMDGYGAVLLQRALADNKLHPVYYMSRKTTDAERKYSSYELEILAVIEAVKKFRVYLLGLHFKIVTDCNAFTKTLNKRDLCTRVARWVLILQEYDYSIHHRA